MIQLLGLDLFKVLRFLIILKRGGRGCGYVGNAAFALSKRVWSLWVTLPLEDYPQAPHERHIHNHKTVSVAGNE